VNLDYQILNAGARADAAGTMDVMLVAAKKDRIADYTGVIVHAGRVPVVVDVDAFALQNAYENNYALDANAIVVLLNVGASAMNINILSGTSPCSRATSPSAGTYTEALQRSSTSARARRIAEDGPRVDAPPTRTPCPSCTPHGELLREIEDARLQGDGLIRSNRPVAAERRLVTRGRL
jgi:Tfp pilus assembly PilM family ATPase